MVSIVILTLHLRPFFLTILTHSSVLIFWYIIKYEIRTYLFDCQFDPDGLEQNVQPFYRFALGTLRAAEDGYGPKQDRRSHLYSGDAGPNPFR